MLCNGAKATAPLAAIIASVVLVTIVSNTFAAPQDSPKAFPSAADAHATVAEVVLPARLATDKPATLAVLDSQGRLAPGVSVELSTGTRVVTNAGGEARFVAGSSAGILTASVPGTPVQAASPVIASTGDSPSAVAIAKYPRVITRAGHFPVTGFNFRGDADLDRVAINGQPALVLAASPFALEISPGPGLALGRANLQIKVAGVEPSPMPLDVVAIRTDRRGPQLTPGRRDDFVIHVDGDAERLALAVWNTSPNVVALDGGNFQKVFTKGGKDNVAILKFRGVHEGAIAISVRLVTDSVAIAASSQVQAELQSAFQMASGDWVPRVAAALERLRADPQNVESVRGDLERMLAEAPPAAMGRHLENAWMGLQS